MGSNNRLASPQGMSAPPGGGYSQTLNINDGQGMAPPAPPWGGSAPQISSPTPMPAQTFMQKPMTMPAPNPMFGPGGGMGMQGGGCGMQQQRCPTCGK